MAIMFCSSVRELFSPVVFSESGGWIPTIGGGDITGVDRYAPSGGIEPGFIDGGPLTPIGGVVECMIGGVAVGTPVPSGGTPPVEGGGLIVGGVIGGGVPTLPGGGPPGLVGGGLPGGGPPNAGGGVMNSGCWFGGFMLLPSYIALSPFSCCAIN